MEILLWLVPPVIVTAVAMAWVGWLGRSGRGEVSHEESLRRLGEALDRPQEARPTRLPAPRVRSTGVALRRTSRTTSGRPSEAASKDQRRAG